jgi:methylated-DNA-protein-cysteine methyltransferase-like protein
MYLNPEEKNYWINAELMKEAAKNKENIYDVIYDIVRCIPRGRVSTYGAVAAAIGLKSGARMVGYAMNNCGHTRPKVPAHRVVNRTGLLTGKHHFNPPDKMQQLLEKEGVKVTDDKVVDFEKKFWDPIKEMDF